MVVLTLRRVPLDTGLRDYCVTIASKEMVYSVTDKPAVSLLDRY